jgi:hypothetical protein
MRHVDYINIGKEFLVYLHFAKLAEVLFASANRSPLCQRDDGIKQLPPNMLARTQCSFVHRRVRLA